MEEFLMDFDEIDSEVINLFNELGYTAEDEIKKCIINLKNALGYDSEEALLVDIEDAIDEEAEEGVSNFLEEIRALIEE